MANNIPRNQKQRTTLSKLGAWLGFFRPGKGVREKFDITLYCW